MNAAPVIYPGQRISISLVHGSEWATGTVVCWQHHGILWADPTGYTVFHPWHQVLSITFPGGVVSEPPDAPF